MKITHLQAFHLAEIPVRPPPFRSMPSKAEALLLKVESDEGPVGWALARHANAMMMAHFIETSFAEAAVGLDPLRTEQVSQQLQARFLKWKVGTLLSSAVSALDIALWDLKGRAFGVPSHHLMGGASDSVRVYITHGAAYGDAPRYTIEELTDEAAFLVEQGNTHLKNTVGRQEVPDPDDDYRRMKAIRERVGDQVKVAMDANSLMTAPAALKLCTLTEELDIAFFEEPVVGNDPTLLAHLRQRTNIPIAAAQTDRVSAHELLSAGAVDLIQPNVNNDGGYTGGMRIAALGEAHNVPLGHGNGAGPHNIALQAALRPDGIVEYHFHRWMMYDAIFEGVPVPEGGRLKVSQEPGLGLEPRPEIIERCRVNR